MLSYQTPKLYANKKGFIASTLVDLYAFLLFMFVLLIFYIIFKLGAGTIVYKIEGETANLNGNTLLINYLKTPIEVDGKEIDIAELILISASSEEHRRELFTVTQSLLTKLNTISDKNDYSIEIKFPDKELLVGEVEGVINRLKINKQGQREVGKIRLPSLTEDIDVLIYNYKGDISLTDFAKGAEVGREIISIDGITYVYWGNGPFSRWSSVGGAWSQQGWPCDTEIKENKVVCKNGYKPKTEDMPCFVTGDIFIESQTMPPHDPKKCFKRDKEYSESYQESESEEPKKEETEVKGEETEDKCKKSDSSTFSKLVRRAEIGDCVIAPDQKTKWINWGYNYPNPYRLWSKEFICDKAVLKGSYLACKEQPHLHPVGTDQSYYSKFLIEEELVKKY